MAMTVHSALDLTYVLCGLYSTFVLSSFSHNCKTARIFNMGKKRSYRGPSNTVNKVQIVPSEVNPNVPVHNVLSRQLNRREIEEEKRRGDERMQEILQGEFQ